MKLHLPKLLLAAVMSVMVAGQHTAKGAEETPDAEVTTNTYTFTDSNSAGNGINLGSYDETYTLIFNQTNNSSNKYFQSASCSTEADIQIGTGTAGSGLYINNGYSGNATTYKVYTFSGDVTGSGAFSKTGGTDYFNYVFEGNMSEYSGNMTLDNAEKHNKLTFNNNSSGTGTITALGSNSLIVNGATMNNSSINVGNLSVAGTSSFAGDVTAGAITLGEGAKVSIAAGKSLTVEGTIAGTTGQLSFGEGSSLIVNGVLTGNDLVHERYGYRKTNWTGDLLEGELTIATPMSVVVEGIAGQMNTDGTVSVTDTYYYIIGEATASELIASGDNITNSSGVKIDNTNAVLTVDTDITLPKLQATQGKITLTKNLSLTGASSITSTTVEGAGELIVSAGTLTVSGSNTQNLKSNMRIQSGATLTFASGYDTLHYNQSGSTIYTMYVDGTMDVGTTRQTVGNWKFELTGGTIQGAGQATNSNIGLDFHSASTITAKAATGATANAPTASTISTKVRYNGALTISVEENALLDMTGGIVAGNTLTKSGVGTLRLANNDNNYGDKAFNVTGGKLELRDNTVTMNGAVTVSNGAALLLKQSATGANTLANVTLNNGSLLVQNSAGTNTTNITKLTVGSNGATIGTERDTSFGNNSHNGNIAIGSLVASTTEESTISFVNSSNTSATTTVYINGGPGANEKAFKGAVKVLTASADDADRRIDLDLASDTALANAVVELGGGTGDKTRYTTNLVLGSATTAVKGIKDAADRKSSGNVIIRTSDVPSTLTINTAGNSYSTTSGIKHAISLVKTGEGTQSFSGDMSTFNGAITVNAGELAFLKDATTLNVSTLTMTDGTVEVKGTLKTSTGFVYSGGTVNANLELGANSSLTLNATAMLDSDKLTLGNSLTLNGSKLAEILALTAGETVDLFSGVSTLVLNGQTYTVGSLTEANGELFDTYFNYAAPLTTTTGSSDIYLGFNSEGVVYAGRVIPEPTTATLSLLALAGLAARRRRK